MAFIRNSLDLDLEMYSISYRNTSSSAGLTARCAITGTSARTIYHPQNARRFGSLVNISGRGQAKTAWLWDGVSNANRQVLGSTNGRVNNRHRRGKYCTNLTDRCGCAPSFQKVRDPV